MSDLINLVEVLKCVGHYEVHVHMLSGIIGSSIQRYIVCKNVILHVVDWFKGRIEPPKAAREHATT